MTSAPRESPALALVCALVPDAPEFHTLAFNRAAQMFQEELIQGLARTGLPPIAVYSIMPMPAFPRGGHILAPSRRVTTARGLAINLLPFVNVQPLKAFTCGLSAFVALCRWSWRHRGESRLIQCVNLTMPPGLFILLAARCTGSKALVYLLDVWRPGVLVPDTWRWRLDYWFQRRLIPRFDGLVVVSQAIADDLAPGRRVCRIEGGVAPERFVGAPAAGHPRAAGPFRVVLAGTLEAYNGVDVALAALDHLPDNYQLIVAGKGSRAEAVRARAAGDPRIVFRGYLDFPQLLEEYWAADLLLNLRLTSAIDTRYFFPSKLMELLASGVPVLSTCAGHIEEEYGPVLYLLRDETPQALADRIVAIAGFEPAARDALGQEAREFMLAHKTWSAQAARLAGYLKDEVLAAHPSPTP